MDLEKKFKTKYNEKEYERIFDAEFREAIKNIDKIAEVISRTIDNKKGR